MYEKTMMVVLSDNGGLLTFRVAKDVMRVGDAFATMEQNKARLHVADYSLAQPTLYLPSAFCDGAHADAGDVEDGWLTAENREVAKGLENAGALDARVDGAAILHARVAARPGGARGARRCKGGRLLATRRQERRGPGTHLRR